MSVERKTEGVRPCRQGPTSQADSHTSLGSASSADTRLCDTEHHFEELVRIPVTFHDGAWVTEDGRELTAFPGTRAEFLAPKGSVPGLWPDESQPERWCSQFLDNGAKLRIALTVRNPSWLSSDLTDKILLSPRSVWGQIEWSAIDGRYSTNSHFIEVGLGEPNERQKEKLPGFTGGLLINMRGEDILSIDPSSLQLPEALADLHANSLNRLLTLLSEKYETHRASHTASIYQKVFYQEWDERWYPLGFLKQSVEGAPRESLAEKFWSANAPVDDDQAESE